MNRAPGPQNVIARCSFCSKPNTEVGTLIVVSVCSSAINASMSA
jgi:hypothetical protein